MTGAAGGLSGGLWGGRGARLVPGAAYVLDAIGFDALMRESAFVVTGEGRLDSQTLAGKIVGEVATRCRQAGVTCHAIVGSNSLDSFDERIIDLASVTEATNLEEMKAAGSRARLIRARPARPRRERSAPAPSRRRDRRSACCARRAPPRATAAWSP